MDEGKSEIDTSVLCDSEGRNVKSIVCPECQCLVLRENCAVLVTIEKELPLTKTPDKKEMLVKYWCIEDMFHFENMGFSNSVDGVKYLACAECDIGPIGWHNLEDKKSYVSIDRVHHK